MTTHGTTQFPRRLTLAAALALLAAFSLTPATRAADFGNVTVSADIAAFTPTLTLTLCDDTADFGSGLNASGDQVTGNSDSVTAIPLDAGLPNGAFYRWTPSCGGGSFITVESNVSWSGTVCATLDQGTGASSLTLSDLRYSGDITQDYSTISNFASTFSDCSSPAPWTSLPQSITPYTFDYFYYLQIAPADTSGSFSATTTWQATA